MPLSSSDRPALVLIDIQQGFNDIAYWGGERNNPHAEEKAGDLLAAWRKHNLPIFHIQHCSANPVSPLHESQSGNAFKSQVQPLPGEPVLKKNVNSAFIGTILQQQLDSANITTLVIAGLTTDHCVSTTTRMAGNLGYNTYLAEDATATFNKTGADGQHFPAALIHETALASLHNEFATVVTTSYIIQSIEAGS